VGKAMKVPSPRKTSSRHSKGSVVAKIATILRK
jgi:hypothetical protein